MLHHLQATSHSVSVQVFEHCVADQSCTRSCHQSLHWCIALRLSAVCLAADMVVTAPSCAWRWSALLLCGENYHKPSNPVNMANGGDWLAGGSHLGSWVQHRSHHSPGEEGSSACASHPHCRHNHSMCESCCLAWQLLQAKLGCALPPILWLR